MKDTPFQNGEYVASALQSSSFPILRSPHGAILPEIAFVGRSNVGKSSLINHLLNVSKLAHVSSTPGKTRMINFFAIDQCTALVDLPGYGYAKVPKETRKAWASGLEDYFQKRETLRLIILLLDIRRSPTQEDVAMAAWSAYHGKSLIIVFTKSDKVGKYEQEQLVRQHLKAFDHIKNLASKTHLVYSTKEKSAREKLISTINEALREGI